MNTKIIHKYRWLAIPVFILILIFSGIAVQYIPDLPIQKHINETCIYGKLRSIYVTKDHRGKDWNTDFVMLLISDKWSKETGYKKFIASPFKTLFPTTPNSHADHIICVFERKTTTYYPRYWHGYQIFLRPLLYFFNYWQILDMNLRIEIALFFLMLLLMLQKRAYGLIVGYILYYILLGPISTGENITYSMMYYLAAISGMLIIKYAKQIDESLGLPIYFAMLGILTSFIDFLTYPICPLSVTLTILYYLNPPQSAKQGYLNLIKYSLAWALGWAGMWSFKWPIATIIMDENIFSDAYQAILTRLAHKTMFYNINMWGGITHTFKEAFKFDNINYLICSILFVYIILILSHPKQALNYLKQKHYQLVCLSAGIFITIFYCLILAGHAVRHISFTYRLWCPALFALIALLGFFWQQMRNTSKAHKNKIS